MRGYNSRSLEDDGPKMVLSSRGARRSSDLDPPPYPASSEEPEISNSGACHAATGGASGTIAAPRHAAGSHMRARERKAMKRPFTDGHPLLNPEGLELLLLQGGDAEVQVQQAEGPSGAQRAAAARNGRAVRHGSLAERSGHVVVPAAAWAQGAGLPQIDEASGGCGISALGMPMASTPLVASDQDSAGLDVDDLPQHAYAHSARMGAPRHGGGGGGGGGAHQPRHHRASSGSVASERGLAAAPVGEQVELEFRPTDMREEIAALQRALEMPSSVEDLQEGYKLPSDSDLAQCLRKRGKGGRNPAADARHDPNIDPKKAQRIMANRESAARSKFRQRLAAEGGRMKMDLLSSQKSKLASEIEELQELIQELEDAQVATHSPGQQPLWPAPGGLHDNGGAGGPHIKPNSPLSSNSNARPQQQQHQQHQYPQQHHHHPTHYQQHQHHPSMLPALCLAGAPASPQQQHPYHHHQYHQHPYHDPHAHAHGHGHGHGHGNGMLAVTRSLPPGMLQHALRRVKPSPSDGSQQLSDDEGVEGMGMGAAMGAGGMGGGMGGGGIGGGPLRMMSTPVFGLNELMSAPAELDDTKMDMRH